MLVLISLHLHLRMLTKSLLAVVTSHRPKSVPEHGTLLHLLPIMQHEAVLHRTFDFVTSAGDELFVVGGDGILEGCLVATDALKAVEEVRTIADAVVEALTTI